jgi:hypothetical protein
MRQKFERVTIFQLTKYNDCKEFECPHLCWRVRSDLLCDVVFFGLSVDGCCMLRALVGCLVGRYFWCCL